MAAKSEIKFNIQGHRGCRALMPENTIPAMIRAIQLGVQTLEMDVVITKDRQVLVSHEPFFNHEISSKGNGEFVTADEERFLNIYKMTYDETTKFDVGLKPHPRFPEQAKMKITKPLLGQLIDSVESYCLDKNLPKPFYNIETKCLPETDNVFHPEPAEFVRLLMKVIGDKGIEQRVIVQSFDSRTLRVVRATHPDIKIALLVDEGNTLSFNDHIQDLGFLPNIYSPHYKQIDKQLISNCRAKNVQIIPWTVNNSKDILHLKKLGVDGIISDDPRLFN